MENLNPNKCNKLGGGLYKGFALSRRLGIKLLNLFYKNNYFFIFYLPYFATSTLQNHRNCKISIK